MSLSVIPPEVLVNVTDYLKADEIGRLLLCGAPRFNYSLLQNGGIRSFRWEPLRSGDLDTPLLLSRVRKHVTRLSIVLPSDGFSPQLKDLHLSELPTYQLEELELCFQNSTTVFFDAVEAHQEGRLFLGEYSSAPPAEHSQASPSASTASSARIGETADMAFFPALKKLVLKGTASIHRFICPPNLTFLQAPCAVLFTSSSLNAGIEFPETLRTLRLSKQPTLPIDVLPLLPPALTDLSLPLISFNRSFALTLDALPRSLTRFETSLPMLNWSSALPRTLTDLKLSNTGTLTVAAVTGLPDGLLHLFLDACDFSQQEKFADIIAALPRPLLSLDFSRTSSLRSVTLAGDFIAYLPKNLTTLRIVQASGVTGVELSELQALPKSLTHYQVDSSLSSAYSEFDGLLPPHLRAFIVPSAWKLSTPFIKALPRTLTQLNIKYNQAIPADSFALLPPHITHLDLSWNNHLTDQHIPLLPSKWLVTLELGSNSKLTNEGIAHLPRTLLHLNLNACARLTGDCFKCLPRRLQSLHLRDLVPCKVLEVRDLPRTLLRLTLSSALLAAACIPHLPPWIIEFDALHGKLFSNDSIPYFPRTLQNLRTSVVGQISSSALEKLPPSMTKLVLCNTKQVFMGITGLPAQLLRIEVE